MKQASRFDGLSFGPFSLFQNGLSAPEVDIGRGEVLQALVIAPVVVMIDKGVDLLSEITRQIVVFQQDTVLEGLMPSLDLTQRLPVLWSATDMVHPLIFEPIDQPARYVACAVVRQQTWLVQNSCLIAA